MSIEQGHAEEVTTKTAGLKGYAKEIVLDTIIVFGGGAAGAAVGVALGFPIELGIVPGSVVSTVSWVVGRTVVETDREDKIRQKEEEGDKD